MNPALVLNDRYRLDQRLAIGGMGEVWQATDELLGRPVAVKLLAGSSSPTTLPRRRFRVGGAVRRVTAAQGIAQVYDYGEQDDRPTW